VIFFRFKASKLAQKAIAIALKIIIILWAVVDAN